MPDALDLFVRQRPDAQPKIYAFEVVGVASHKDYIKVGYTVQPVKERVKEIMHTSAVPYRILGEWSAMKNDGSSFMDHDVHAVLRKRGFHNLNAGEDRNEWFHCTLNDVKAAVYAVSSGTANQENRSETFAMRPEQQRAVDMTMAYFASVKQEDPTRTPKFLWNAKMRFGKTFASYQLAKKMGMTKVLVLTFKPAVESAWREDLERHVDFAGWQFISKDGLRYEDADLSRPIVCFGSFQDYLGTNDAGGIKAKNEWVHLTNWDIVIFDEYHFGAWRENAKKLFDTEDEDSYDTMDMEKYKKEEADNAYNETFLPITTSHYLFLSGTPFRAINSGEFIEEQVFNWTYSDEQAAKRDWGDKPNNPYAALPKMVMLTYQMPEEIRRVAQQGEFDEFDLNLFFSAKGKEDDARFVYENEVSKWLSLIQGRYLPTSLDDLKIAQNRRPAMPFADARFKQVLNHTFWFLPNVACCYAMANLLKKDRYFSQYKINVCAGTGAGIGLSALAPVQASMGDPLETRTITLSCGKLATGVTVKPWTGIFMLRNLSSPETYFQAAFRVQSPWEIRNDDGSKTIMKQECYVFDFALTRALKQISDYSCRLDINESDPEKKVGEFIQFLPVIAYDGSHMRQINAEEILNITMSGTSATLLAKRWESALLVNVDNETLARLMANKDAMDALMNIEGFRSLNSDIETIINKSEAVKKAKKEKEGTMTPKEKKELSEEEKEYKSKRKQIQEKLIKFATRVPVFMYLTDFREKALKDIITQLEPGLFKKVTGLNVKDFELLVSLGVFNGPLMNDAIYKFKRYEDASLSYTGLNQHAGEDVGLWDTVISNMDYMNRMQQNSMQAPERAADDVPTNPLFVMDDEPTLKKPMATTLQTQTPVRATIEQRLAANPVTPVFSAQSLRPAVIKPAVPAAKKDYTGYVSGARVMHKKFGEGTIERIQDGRICVTFGKAEKMFQYPQAIDSGFIELL